MSFKEVEPHPNFPKIEEEILKFWQEENIFQKSLDKNPKSNKFVFYEGPPTANGKPGIHHVLARAYKDLIPRYKTMQGYYVKRRAGWDTHGLPVEIEVEKKLGLKNKKEIEDYGIDEFNKACRESVWQYKEEWEKLTERMGFWLDLSDPYITYENSYIEKVWEIIKQIWDKNLIYSGHKVVPYCPRCGTTLSTHELAQGYKNIEEESIYLKFKFSDEDKYLLVWTTTPWTLPANIALAVNPEIDYVEVELNNENYILAKNRAAQVLGGNPKIIKEFKGQDLIDKSYVPLYDISKIISKTNKDYKIYGGDFVTADNGTGIVHIAPAFGEDDMNLQKKYQFSVPLTVSDDGLMLTDIGKGKFVKSADRDIKQDLEKRNLYFKSEMFKHDYPFCWRCEGPLIYFAKSSWFIDMSKVKEKLISNNEEINWYPSYIKNGRFGEWLKEVKDWAISRERYWGTPLPIWQCECGENQVIGSLEELKGQATKEIGDLDLHKPYIDEIEIKCPKCGQNAKRVKEVLDVWLDSGSMPFASGEYPDYFPADYIAEAIDQTRGWFYTMLGISTLLDKGPSYKNVICLAHVLDDKGKKMSKSKGNVIDPWTIINKYGVDSLRWYFYVVNGPGEAKKLGEKEIEQHLRKFILILWNVYSFFITYANVDNWDNKEIQRSDHALDRWIQSRLNEIVAGSDKTLGEYNVTAFARQIQEFTNDLSTWYLRRSRTRRDENFYSTLHQTLFALCKIIAPLVPFTAESIYQNLKNSSDPESVHLCVWPRLRQGYGGQAEAGEIDKKLLNDMQQVRDIAEAGHAQRAENNLRLRQPLAKIEIPCHLSDELKTVLKEELNVFDVVEGKVVKLDTTMTEELKAYGTMRDLIRLIQDLRKKAGFVSGQKAILYYKGDKKLEDILTKFKTEITKITNAELKNADTEKTIADGGFELASSKIWLGVNK